MTASQIFMYALQTVTTLIIGLVGWGIKNAITEMKSAIKKNADDIEKLEAKFTQEVEKIRSEHSELKSDLPFVYVLREDFIRTLNSVDKCMCAMDSKLDKILHIKLTTKEE